MGGTSRPRRPRLAECPLRSAKHTSTADDNDLKRRPPRRAQGQIKAQGSTLIATRSAGRGGESQSRSLGKGEARHNAADGNAAEPSLGKARHEPTPTSRAAPRGNGNSALIRGRFSHKPLGAESGIGEPLLKRERRPQTPPRRAFWRAERSEGTPIALQSPVGLARGASNGQAGTNTGTFLARSPFGRGG